MILRWPLLLALSAVAAAQDISRATWIMPSASGTTALQAEASGRVRLARAEQKDSCCWRLLPAQGGYYVICNAFGGKRGLTLRQGKPCLAEQRGELWEVKDSGGGVYRLHCSRGRLGDHDWTLWARQRLDRRPQPGNYLRSDMGQYWRVQRNGLAGRSEPHPRAPLVKSFGRGTVFLADWGRGGSDEVFWNAVDLDGNTWLKVKDRQGKALNCYVRANSTWLKPFDLDNL